MKEKWEQEAERVFNKTHPMYPQKKREAPQGRKTAAEASAQATPDCPTASAGLSDAPDCSVESTGLSGTPPAASPATHQDLEERPVDTGSSRPTGESVSDDEMLDYGDSPDHSAMDVSMITFSADYKINRCDDEEVAQFDFGPKEAVFTKPEESVNHVKPLYVRGHIDGRPISRMLVDGGAVVNVMPYELFRKLGKVDDELVKINMTLAGVGGENPIEAKGIASMELTIGSKTIATAFFIAEV